jgi:uncharacterized membrane protein YsdA (DUF1294 family)
MLVLAVALYLLAVNATTYGMFAWDKRCARLGQWRVPERSLIAMAAIGGSAGAVMGQRLLRHKTRKQPFGTYLQVVVIVHLALLALGVGLAVYGV